MASFNQQGLGFFQKGGEDFRCLFEPNFIVLPKCYIKKKKKAETANFEHLMAECHFLISQQHFTPNFIEIMRKDILKLFINLNSIPFFKTKSKTGIHI